MTIDDQLRDLARRADQHQQVITTEEVVQRASGERNRSSVTRSRLNGQTTSFGELTVSSTEEEATLIDLDSDTQTSAPRKTRKSLVAAGLLAAAAVVAIALVVRPSDDTGTPADEPPATTSVPALGSIPAGDAPIEAGSYLVPSSPWSVADFTVTFPEGWNVQYGHMYAKSGDGALGFAAVVVDEIWAESCAGSNSGPLEVGPGVDDLTAALLQLPGPTKSEPIDTTLGGYPATRIELTVPNGFDLGACNAADVGLQIWYSEPADMNFVLIDDHTASVYILDINGQRQVFLTQHGPDVTDADLAELQAILDSIRIEEPMLEPEQPTPTATASEPAPSTSLSPFGSVVAGHGCPFGIAGDPIVMEPGPVDPLSPRFDAEPGQNIAHTRIGSQVAEVRVPGYVHDSIFTLTSTDGMDDIELDRGPAKVWSGANTMAGQVKPFVQALWFSDLESFLAGVDTEEACSSFTVTVDGGTEDANRELAIDLAQRILLPSELGDPDLPGASGGPVAGLELEGSEWEVASTTNGAGPPDGAVVAFGDTTVTWDDGCATVTANYDLDRQQGTLTLTNRSSTDPGCAPVLSEFYDLAPFWSDIRTVMDTERITAGYVLEFPGGSASRGAESLLRLGDPMGVHIVLAPPEV